jgi:hypothetical protein
VNVTHSLSDNMEYTDENNLCGKPHNNGDEADCLECGVIRYGI